MELETLPGGAVKSTLFLVGLLVLAFSSSSQAKTISRVAPTGLTVSATRSAGTVTAEAVFTSPDPHCLDAERWRRLAKGGYDLPPEFALDFAGPIPGHAVPPGGTELSPASPFGRSPLIWKAVWPASATVRVEADGPVKTEDERFYTATVASASGADGGGFAPPSRHSPNFFETTYKSAGDKIQLKCKLTPGGYRGVHKTIVF